MTNTENPIPIPAAEWQQVHHRVVPFIDGDERRGHGMVLLTTHDGRRRWVGTDYARLVVLDGGCQESEVTALLSHRLICAAVQLGEPEGDDVELSIEPDGAGGRAACTVGAGPARVTLPGRCPVFPDWESVAHDPQEIAAMATVDRDTFRTLLDEARHAPGGTDLDGQVPLCWLDVGLDGLRIEVTWSCFGLSTFALSCPTSGRARVPVNPRFLHELLNAAGEGDLRLTFGREPSDLLVLAAADGWTGYLAPIDAERGGGPAEGRARHRRGLRHRAGARRGRRLPADGGPGASLRPPDLRGAAPPAALRPRGDRRLRRCRAARGVERAEPASALRQGQPEPAGSSPTSTSSTCRLPASASRCSPRAAPASPRRRPGSGPCSRRGSGGGAPPMSPIGTSRVRQGRRRHDRTRVFVSSPARPSRTGSNRVLLSTPNFALFLVACCTKRPELSPCNSVQLGKETKDSRRARPVHRWHR